MGLFDRFSKKKNIEEENTQDSGLKDDWFFGSFLMNEAKYILQFFGLTKSDFFGFDGEMDVVDEIHSQGRKRDDFGSAHYEIRLCELHPNVRREIEERGGNRTDSTWVLTKVKGNIRGELVVRHNNSKAYVHYYQIYGE